MTEIKLDAKALEAAANVVRELRSSTCGKNDLASGVVAAYLAALPNPASAERGAVEAAYPGPQAVSAARNILAAQAAEKAWPKNAALPPAPAAGVSEDADNRALHEESAALIEAAIADVTYLRSALKDALAHRPEPSARQEEAAVIGKEAGGGWRSMDSAPKDGTRVDIWCAPKDAAESGNAHRRTDAYYRDGNWWFKANSGNYDVKASYHWNVVAWMRRPTAPLTPGGQADGPSSTEQR